MPKNYKQQTNPFLLIAIIIIGFGLISATIINLISVFNTKLNTASNSSPQTVTSPNNPTQENNNEMTLAKFEQIQNGMKIAEVQKLVGSAGKLLSENKNSDKSIGKVFWWQNPQGSNAIIEFSNDRVVSKSQSGLK